MIKQKTIRLLPLSMFNFFRQTAIIADEGGFEEFLFTDI